MLRIRDVYPGSRILIFTHPGYRITDPGSRIPDPKTVPKERDEKNFVIILFSVVTNFTKLNTYYVIFEMLKKKFGPIFKELLKFVRKKFSICYQIYGFGIRDPRSGIRENPIPDPGSRGQKGTGSATLAVGYNATKF